MNRRAFMTLIANSAPIDTTAPTVTTFTATTPSGLTVAITEFTGSEDGVQFLITESATKPSAGAAGWSASAPTTYTVDQEGDHILYPYVKDGAGNVSVHGEAVLVQCYDWLVNGNVANSGDGRSLAGAFKTIVELTAWVAGQSVWIQPISGSVPYYEELLYPGNNAKAYSNGVVDPVTGVMTGGAILDASGVIVNANITKTAGRTNVYEISVTFAGARSGETAFANVWENDVFLKLVASVAACDSTPGSYYLAAYTGTQTLYIHPPGSTDPITNGKVYTHSKRWYGVSCAYSNCSIMGLRTQKNLSQNGSLGIGTSCTATDCSADYGSKHNVFYGDGCTFTRVFAHEANYNASATMFVCNANAPAGLGSTLNYCGAIQTQGLSAGGAIIGFHSHVNVSGGFGVLTYNYCKAIGIIGGFQGNHATDIYFNNCITTGCISYGYYLADSAVTYHIVGGVHIITGSNTAQIVNGHTTFTGTVNITNVTFTANKPGQEGLIWLRAACTCNLIGGTYTITDTSGAYRIVVASSAACTVTGSGVHFVIADAPSDGYGYSLTNASANLTSDNNIFSHNAIQMNYRGNVYANLAAQQAQGFEVHSTVG